MKEWAKAIVYSLVFLFLVQQFLYNKVYVQTEGMAPNIIPGDYLLMNKWDKSAEHGSIMIFEQPTIDTSKLFVQRFIGMPGDTISLSNGQLIRNSDTILEHYSIKLDTHRLYSIRPETSLDCKTCNWDLDNFGPVVIPSDGMKIRIDQNNLHLYKKALALELSDSLAISDNSENIVIEHTFSRDYYFSLGDNRHNTIDSRFFGIIPEENIIGKTETILFHFHLNSPGFFALERAFKSLNK